MQACVRQRELRVHEARQHDPSNQTTGLQARALHTGEMHKLPGRQGQWEELSARTSCAALRLAAFSFSVRSFRRFSTAVSFSL